MGIVLNDRCYSDVDEISVTEDNIDVVSFLTEWFDDREYVIGHTSGSTGTPKKIYLLKSDMEASARLTNEFFGIDTYHHNDPKSKSLISISKFIN